jgi:hypothetical protein
MPHPVVYPGDFKALLKKWSDQRSNDWAEDHSKMTFIADGQCARLPQALTSVGHTSRWRPGERVIDVARTLQPGTVIANFWFELNEVWYPNTHGYHAALFVRGEGYSVVTGKPSQIIMFDQWVNPSRTVKGSHPPGTRAVRAYSYEVVKQRGYYPSDIANDFYVVLVP